MTWNYQPTPFGERGWSGKFPRRAWYVTFCAIPFTLAPTFGDGGQLLLCWWRAGSRSVRARCVAPKSAGSLSLNVSAHLLPPGHVFATLPLTAPWLRVARGAVNDRVSVSPFPCGPP